MAAQRKAPGELGSNAGHKLRTKLEYHALCFLAKLFGKPFWFFEQWRGLLGDRIENEKGDR